MIHNAKIALAAAALMAAVATAPAVYATEEEAQVIELENGTTVQVKGEEVFVVGADGSLTPAPDGEHVTKDGKTITTKDGKIAE